MYRSLLSLLGGAGLVLSLGACQFDPVREGYQDPYYAPYPQVPYYVYPGYPMTGGYPVGGYHAVEPDGRSNVRHRIEEAQQSIDRGVRQGSLTRMEAQTLNRELDAVRHEAARSGRDGHIGGREQQRINAELNRLQTNIRREKRDDDRRSR